MAKDEIASDSAISEGFSRRQLAVARSLDSARTRAEHRVQRFLDAAFELMQEGSDTKFTVQDVVERSGQSLRSFYQYFDGKYELLLALFEESIRSTAEFLREELAKEEDDFERLHTFVVEYFHICCKTAESQNTSIAPVIVEFAQQLLTAHPKEATRAFVPLVSLFGEVFDKAVAAGVVRSDIPRAVVTGVVLESVMFNAFSSTIGGTQAEEVTPEQLWQLVFCGMGSSVGRARSE